MAPPGTEATVQSGRSVVSSKTGHGIRYGKSLVRFLLTRKLLLVYDFLHVPLPSNKGIHADKTNPAPPTVVLWRGGG
jgi:hypothetical protein